MEGKGVVSVNLKVSSRHIFRIVMSLQDQKDNYSLLSSLYAKVEEVTGTLAAPEIPFFRSITKSLQCD